MFTGIINDYGAVAQIDRHQNSSKIKITTARFIIKLATQPKW
jgi:riboflavin synthase